MRMPCIVVLMTCLLAAADARGGDVERCDDHPDYAESVMLSAISMDGRRELALRLARRPADGTGTIWMHVAVDDAVFSTVEENVPLHADSICMRADGSWSELRLGDVALHRDGDDEQATVRIEADLGAAPHRHPEVNDGRDAVSLLLEFRPDDRQVRIHGETRSEVYGEVRGIVTTPSGNWDLALPANWHEQTGPRRGFAPSFTYFNVQNDEVALLAIRYEQGAVGYLIDAHGQRAVTAFEVEPEGAEERRFRIEVDGADAITGTATVAQRWSVPIDGARRPGSGVVAVTSVGTLAGSLNDWVAPPGSGGAATADAPADRFLAAFARHCGNAYPGRLMLEPEGDPMLSGDELLLVHVRDCLDAELRLPFHVEAGTSEGWDSSRTWYLMRTESGLELRHDHRLADGSEDQRTWYGGVTETPGTAVRQDFASPERTAAAGVPVGWRIEIESGVAYRYGTTYEGEYDWMIEFDLSEPFAGPVPEAWGHPSPPSRIPGPP